MSMDHDLHKNILENMRDGVMALDFEGRITLFNPAAAAILGLAPEGVLNQTFAAVFLMADPPSDDFNQLILDAVYQKKAGHQDTVAYYRAGGQQVILAITTSYLRKSDAETAGVILVFSDITDLQALQSQEKENTRKLADAYRNLEESNSRLNQLLKKAQIIRVTATLGIVLLFAGLGLYHFQGLERLKQLPGMATSAEPPAPAMAVHTITPQPLSSSISLSGRLQPVEEIVLTAPFEGRILERHFVFGQMVQKGDRLLLLDTSELEVRRREALGNQIKALQRHREVVDWENGSEMTRARRSLQRSTSNLDKVRRELEEAELLFANGIIAAQELERARQQVENTETEVLTAREELAATRQKGGEESLKLAQMELDNAQTRLDEINATLIQADMQAPVSGVVIQPSAEEDKKVTLEVGARVSAGVSLVALGNLDGMRVHSRVDEVDIGRLAAGQTVTARGDAFPGIHLTGHVSHISAQATGAGGHQAPGFDVQVTIPALDERAARVIRVGMSADLEVQVHNNPEALMVPLHLVKRLPTRTLVQVLEADGTIREQEVRTGMTTLTAVEITEGLRSGQQLTGW